MAYPVGDLPAFVFWEAPRLPLANIDPWCIRDDEGDHSRCAMCGHAGYAGPGMHVDHDHVTGLVRGPLCASCNSLEVGNSHPAFVAWREGLNPASVYGHDVYYYDDYGPGGLTALLCRCGTSPWLRRP